MIKLIKHISLKIKCLKIFEISKHEKSLNFEMHLKYTFQL